MGALKAKPELLEAEVARREPSGAAAAEAVQVGAPLEIVARGQSFATANLACSR